MKIQFHFIKTAFVFCLVSFHEKKFSSVSFYEKKTDSVLILFWIKIRMKQKILISVINLIKKT